LPCESKIFELAHVEIPITAIPAGKSQIKNPNLARREYCFVPGRSFADVAAIGQCASGFHAGGRAVFPGCGCPDWHVIFEYYDWNP
jgi:hypothetical protein